MGNIVVVKIRISPASSSRHLDSSTANFRPVGTLATFDFKKRKPPAMFSKGELQDTANTTCETILLGFAMSISTNILLNGVIQPECYDHTPNAKRIQNELKENSKLWMSDKESIMFQRFEALEGLLDAIKMKDFEKIQKIYYRSQHQHVLGTTASPFSVPIYINSNNLDQKWIQSIDFAIECINTATPGLRLYTTEDEKTSKICIDKSEYPEQAYTTFKSRKPYICLGSDWKGDFQGTATHELLHALGFQHEMQRWDADLYSKFNKLENDGNSKQYEKLKQGLLTRFDPFSVLMYADPKMTRKKQDPIWKLKPSPDRLQRLSELNKVALNLLYEPVISAIYKPQISEQTGMLYCGRKVMETHNQCSPPTTDNCCGPNNWANCPACRVIKSIKSTNASLPTKIEKLELCLAKNKWQGLSGLFYCGTKYSKQKFSSKHNGVFVENDGICGGNNGIPCTNCGEMLFPEYEWEQFVCKTPVYGPGYGPGFGPAYGPGYGPAYGHGYGPAYGPGYGPAYEPGYGPAYGPGYGPAYGPGYGPASGLYGPGYPPAYRH